MIPVKSRQEAIDYLGRQWAEESERVFFNHLWTLIGNPQWGNPPVLSEPEESKGIRGRAVHSTVRSVGRKGPRKLACRDPFARSAFAGAIAPAPISGRRRRHKWCPTSPKTPAAGGKNGTQIQPPARDKIPPRKSGSASERTHPEDDAKGEAFLGLCALPDSMGNQTKRVAVPASRLERRANSGAHTPGLPDRLCRRLT